LFNGFSFIFSGISEIFIKIPQKLPVESERSGKNIPAFIKELTGGFNFIWKNRGLKGLVLLSAFINFFTMPVIVLLPFYIEDFLLLKEDWYGYILALYGAGTLVGYFSASLLKISGKSRSFLIITLMILESAGYASLSFIHDPLFSLALALIIGAMNGYVMVNILTIVQTFTPSVIRGRVFGFLTTLTGALAPLGMGLSGIVFDLLGHNLMVIYTACGVIMIAGVLITARGKDFREILQIDADKILPEPDSELSSVAGK
ncbi:MAG: MFS transporter, partial [Syntrophothermus sp.]